MSTSTKTESKTAAPRSKPAAAAAAAAAAKTDLKTEIRPSVQKAVNSFVIADKQSQSKLWPLVEEALQMHEAGIDRKESIRQFRAAFAKANHVTEGELSDNADYVNYSMTAARITSIAEMGRKWVEEKQERKMGFWRMFDESKEEPRKPKSKSKSKGQGTGAANGAATNHDDDDDSVAGMRRQAKEGVANADTYAEATDSAPHMKADRPWRTRCRIIAKDEPDAFIEMMNELVAAGLLPDAIVQPLTSYLHGD